MDHGRWTTSSCRTLRTRRLSGEKVLVAALPRCVICKVYRPGASMSLKRFFLALLRGLRLRCPRCGAPGIFDGFWTLRRFCRACNLRFEREQGYFIGAIYINYFATVSIAI